MIKSIKLENFKRVSLFETELNKINVLVGTNNSGKSSVLQGIHFTVLLDVARRLYHNGNKTVAQNEMLYIPTGNSASLRHGEPYSVSSGNKSLLKLTNEADETCEIELRKGRGFGNMVVETSGTVGFRQQVSSSDPMFVSYTPGVSGIATSEQLVGKAVLRNAAARGDANLFLHNIIYYINDSGDLDRLNEFVHTVFPECTISVNFDPANDVVIKVNVEVEEKHLPLNLCGTGFLQVVQIMAYSVYFKPKLLLLDEPDEHLHPENQQLLCEAIKTISDRMDMQVILATHSRHILSALKDEAKLIWMQDGKISDKPITENMYEVLVDLGALDSYDAILQGRYSYVILTEDADQKYLKKLLEFNGFDLSGIRIISYSSCSHLDAALTLADYLQSAAPRVKYLVHRDRDFMTDKEIEQIAKKFKNPNVKLWVTDECDIEAYFTRIDHISHITGKSVAETTVWIKSLLASNHVDIQHAFEEKRNEIKKQLYVNEVLKGLENIADNRWPSTMDLFGRNVPTSRNNVKGKYMLKKCNGDMVNFAGATCNLIANSPDMNVQSLRDALA